jgi:signal transduction histidine kinase
MAKLRPRARIIRTIGDQLISGPDAALIELVKNAFDADSPYIKIKITPKSQANPDGMILVQDQGHGMSYVDVVERWFEPATDEKQKRRFSPGNRLMLGAKGIGRFAASRLGTKTQVHSVALLKNGQFEEVRVDVDWNDFTSEKYLEDIDIPVEHQQILNIKIQTGVALRISDLRDIWSLKRIEGLVRELRRLASPNEAGDNFVIHLDISDFTTQNSGFNGTDVLLKLNNDISNEDDEILDPTVIVPFRVQEHADYKLEGKFDITGAFHGTFTNCKGDNNPQEISVPVLQIEQDELQCGALNLRLNVYDLETDSVSELFGRMKLDFEKIGIRAARKILNENAGIAIFRNGFRIRPYGEPEYDWLELERKRVQNPSRKLGLSQVSGRVEVENEEKSLLVERSSREGLEHNGAFERLKRLIEGVLTRVEDKRVDFREKAGLSRKASGDVSQVKSLASLQAVSKAVAKLPPSLQEPMRKAIEKDSGALSASLDEIDAFQKLLQSRASLGLVVAQVIHEGRRILNPMSTAARSLIEHKDWLLEQTKRGEVARKQFPEHAITLGDGTKSLSRLFKRLDPVSGRRRGKPSDFAIYEVVSSALTLFESAIAEGNIHINVDLPSDVKVHGYVEDFQAAILNIIENAIYWLSSSGQSSRNIDITHEIRRNVVRLNISNDGPVLDVSFQPRLFHAGFSLKSDGTGLGLAIAREACRASKGDLNFDSSKLDTTFVVEFPLAEAH